MKAKATPPRSKSARRAKPVKKNTPEKKRIPYALLEEAQALAHLGSFEWDIAQDQITWSDELYRMYGLEPGAGSLTLATLVSMIHPDDRELVQRTIGQAVKTRSAFRMHERIVRPNGEIRTLESFGRIIVDKQGKPVRIVGACLDVTEETGVQRMLMGFNNALEQIAGNVGLPSILEQIVSLIDETIPEVVCSILLLEPDGVHLQTAAGGRLPREYCEAINGLAIGPKTGSCGTAAYEQRQVIVSDIQTDPLWESFKDLAARFRLRSCWSTPILSSRADAGTAEQDRRVLGTFAIYSKRVRTPTTSELQIVNRAARLAGIAIERIQASREIHESERRFRELADSIPQLVWTADREGKYIYVNRRLNQLIGTASDSDRWTWFIHPDDRERAIADWKNSLATGEPFLNEHRILDQSTGQYRWHLARAVCWRSPTGEIERWYGVSTDVEQMKQTEAAMHDQQAKLAHLSRLATAGELASGIAHEINQPLGAILLYAETSRELLRKGTADRCEVLNALDRVVSQVERARETVTRMRDFIKQRPLEKASHDLNQLLANSVKYVKYKLDQSGIELRHKYAANLPPVHVDGVLIEQVTVNLLLNAIHALSEKGVEQKLIKLSSAVDEKCCSVSICDTGRGVAPDVLPHLFESFVSGSRQGLGLGLSISRSILERHGGRVHYEPTKSGGSKFRFELPLGETRSDESTK